MNSWEGDVHTVEDSADVVFVDDSVQVVEDAGASQSQGPPGLQSDIIVAALYELELAEERVKRAETAVALAQAALANAKADRAERVTRVHEVRSKIYIAHARPVKKCTRSAVPPGTGDSSAATAM